MIFKKIKFLLYSLLVLSIMAFLLFNEYGIVKYIKLKNEVDNLNLKIEQAENQIKKLTAEIDSLQNNNFKIEKVAREKYHMLGESEQALNVEENN